MSPLEQKAKKRKHAGEGEPTPKRSKTEKDKLKQKGATNVNEVVAKKDKGKRKADGEFSVVQAELALSIPPVFASNLRAGAEEMLDSMVMRCDTCLRSIQT